MDLTRGRSRRFLRPGARYLAQHSTTPPRPHSCCRIFDGHHSIIDHLSSHTTQRTPCVFLLTSTSTSSPPTPQRGGELSHTTETQRTRPSSPVRLHARRALAHALPPTAAAADLTHLFRTPSHWSSAFHTHQTWKAPALTQRYTSTMPFVRCGRRSRSPRSTSPSTRWRMVPR
jgi:hypothetical protein